MAELMLRQVVNQVGDAFGAGWCRKTSKIVQTWPGHHIRIVADAGERYG